jgi:hypothetical protein
VTWEALGEITAPSGRTFSSPRIQICSNTGFGVIAAIASDGVTPASPYALYASLNLQSWVGPSFAQGGSGISLFSVAAGRLFASFDAGLLTTDGVVF